MCNKKSIMILLHFFVRLFVWDNFWDEFTKLYFHRKFQELFWGQFFGQFWGQFQEQFWANFKVNLGDKLGTIMTTTSGTRLFNKSVIFNLQWIYHILAPLQTNLPSCTFVDNFGQFQRQFRTILGENLGCNFGGNSSGNFGDSCKVNFGDMNFWKNLSTLTFKEFITY